MRPILEFLLVIALTRYRRDASVLCGVLVLACVLAERRGTPVPPELLAASTRLLSGGHVEVVW